MPQIGKVAGYLCLSRNRVLLTLKIGQGQPKSTGLLSPLQVKLYVQYERMDTKINCSRTSICIIAACILSTKGQLLTLQIGQGRSKSMGF